MYWTLFFTFAKIGMFTICGGYAMIPLIEREIVNKGWLDSKDFMDIFAVTQSLPGVFAVNISIFVGYRLRKIKGSIICALGSILPAFAVMLSIAVFFTHFQDNVWVSKIFNGIRPAVVALILVPCIHTARAVRLRGLNIIFVIAGALLIWLAGISPAYIVLGAIVGGLVYTFWIKEKIGGKI